MGQGFSASASAHLRSISAKSPKARLSEELSLFLGDAFPSLQRAGNGEGLASTAAALSGRQSLSTSPSPSPAPILNELGVVSNIHRLSLRDGPGIRTTVFLKGCLLRCPWCNKPESMARHSQVMIRENQCVGSDHCIEHCPQQAISKGAVNRYWRKVDWKSCDQCGKCAEVCSSNAIEMVGRRQSISEVIGAVALDAGFYRRSGGGMTVSGGEPLLQWEFTVGLLREAKRKGYHTALDTSGHADWEVLEEVLEHVDLVLFDVKHTNSTKHRFMTGVPNEKILENLERTISRTNSKVWIRYPLIPRFNDGDEDFESLCKLVSGLGSGVEKLSLLPYDTTSIKKYVGLGRKYLYQETAPLCPERIETLRGRAESYGIEVEVGR